MQQLWAPWRTELIHQKAPPGCIFCLFPAETGAEADRRNLIVGRTARSFAILNRYPYNNGHLMVVPRRHIGDFASLSSEESADLHALLRRSTEVLNRAYRPEGMNLGMNLGKSAGAGIADHLHWHVVPRWVGDTNFMPVLSETKVMNEHLQSTFDKLQPLFRDGPGG
jgi:ATP adenylyltransferase